MKGKLWWWYSESELPQLQGIYDAGGTILKFYKDGKANPEEDNFRVIFEVDRSVAVEKGWAASEDSEEWLDEEDEE